MEKVIIITQARMGSTRLPGKVMLKCSNKELLKIHLDRLFNSKRASKVIVATTLSDKDLIIKSKCDEWGVSTYSGSENDVLDRYYKAAIKENPDYVVRVTSDCPLVDPILIDEIIDFTIKNNLDYCSNTFIERFPDGQDIEVFKFDSLKKAWLNAKLNSDREHVTPYIKKNSSFNGGNLFTSQFFDSNTDFSKIRMTVDEQVDYELVNILIDKLGTDKSWLDYTNFIIDNGLLLINGDVLRNEGYYNSLKNDK